MSTCSRRIGYVLSVVFSYRGTRDALITMRYENERRGIFPISPFGEYCSGILGVNRVIIGISRDWSSGYASCRIVQDSQIMTFRRVTKLKHKKPQIDHLRSNSKFDEQVTWLESPQRRENPKFSIY